MSEQVYTLIEELKKYRDSDKTRQDENYFTEILKWYLNNVDYFRKEFLEIIGVPEMYSASFKSQERLYGQDGFMDLFAETENDILIIENKIQHKVYESQLKKYIEDVHNRDKIESKNRKVHLCLITKYRNDDIIIKFLDTHSEDSKRIHKTWQDLHDELVKRIPEIHQTETIWKLLNTYIVSSGLLRRVPLTSSRIETESKSFLKGQCKSIMEDLLRDEDIKKMFLYYRSIFEIGDDESYQTIEYRWGRIGLNLRRAHPDFSKNWWPNIFIGVVLDGTDHKLKPFDSPKLVVIVEWYYHKTKSKSREIILETWRESLKKFKTQNQEENTKIHLHDDLDNKWRFIVIEKDLNHFINKKDTKTQDKEIISFYTKWLNTLSEKLGIESIFAEERSN